MCLYFHRKHSCWIRCMDSDREIERCSILLSSSETEGFRKQSYPRPPTITGLTPPDPPITAPPPIYTYVVHQTNIEGEYGTERPSMVAWGWGININTARRNVRCRRHRHRRPRGLGACQTCVQLCPQTFTGWPRL